MVAPGAVVTAAAIGNGMTAFSGTSMASPHVAGIAALYLANNSGASPAQVTTAILSNGSSGRLSGIGSGSPNLLAYSLFDGDGGGGGGSTELTNGVPETGLSGNQGSELRFTIEVPSGASDLEISMSGGSGDADLYVRRGAAPTTSSYDCRPWRTGNNESCSESSPQAGTWHIMVRGYSSFSGVSLVASFDEPGGGGGSGELNNGVPVTGLSGGSGSESHFSIAVPSGASNLEISMSGGSGDADLYVRRGAPPTSTSYDCRPWLTGNNESCSSASPQAGTWYIMIRGYSSYSGVSLVASFDGPGSGAPCTNCTHFSGTLTSGAAQIQPNGDYYQAPSGTHQAWLQGPSSADFDLELYRWSGSSWTRVANSASTGSNEHVSYSGSSGYYYWRVLSWSGSGSYDLWLNTP